MDSLTNLNLGMNVVVKVEKTGVQWTKLLIVRNWHIFQFKIFYLK